MGGTTQRGFFQRTTEQIEAAKAQIREQMRQTWERGEDLANDVAKGLRTYAETQTTAAQLQAAQQARAARAVGEAVVQAVRPRTSRDIDLRGPQPIESPRSPAVPPQGRYLVDLTKPDANPFMTTYARDKDGNIDRTRSKIDEYPASGLGVQPMSDAELKGRIVDLLAGKPVDAGPHVTFVNDKPSNPSPNQPLITPTARMVAGGIVDSGVRSVNINSTTGGKHSTGSLHYKDRAVDMNRIDGRRVDDPAIRSDTLRLQNTFGKQGNIGENFGPNYLERVYGDRLVRIQNRKLADDHQDHVHAGGRN